MTENEKPNPGAPVAEDVVEENQVLEAVQRARAVATEESADQSLAASVTPVDASTDRVSADPQTPLTVDEVELRRREELSEVATEMDLPRADDASTAGVVSASAATSVMPEVVEVEELPSAAAEADVADPEAMTISERDGEIRISAEHPMAALYMQTPMPPDLRGNRGVGVLISLVAMVGFGLVLTGVYAAWQAPQFPPSTYLSEGLLPLLQNWGFEAAVFGFFAALALLVLIVGRAGWWAYIVFGVFVGVATWLAATAGAALYARFGLGIGIGTDPFAIIEQYGFTMPAIAAGIVAREVTVWFGAWIGFRGRRVRNRNAELLDEYDVALAEVNSK
ncbi:hypothetical protein ICL81_07285 [Leucobacter sp. cx-328]|uniref:hypothetical protein n=1 Tax=unclassified Leucobacter TaxID=2621730 RepID=UPI00165EA557|nr:MULTISPECIES: hypothetical protein [unclassified Leucobacter]MBC9944311.1 hypothetical protein [Leucobacter sp. cx-328]